MVQASDKETIKQNLPREVLQARPAGKRRQSRPRSRWRDYVSALAWDHLGFPGQSWLMRPGTGESGTPVETAASAT